MEQKKSKGKKTGIIGKKKGGTAVAFRPQDIIDAKFDLDCFGQDILDAVFARVGENEDADDNLTYTCQRRGTLGGHPRLTSSLTGKRGSVP